MAEYLCRNSRWFAMNCIQSTPTENPTLPKLFYRKDGADTRPLPGWAGYLQLIGAMASLGGNSGRRTLVAVAVPTRAYAAVFAALGVVASRARFPILPTASHDYFAHLCGLPKETKIWVTDRGVRYKGKILGPDLLSSQPVLKIQTATMTRYIGESKSIDVEVDEWDGDLPCGERGRRTVRRAGFLEAAFGGHDLGEFGIRSRLDAVVIGSAASLRNEVGNTNIGAPLPTGNFVYGTFQDLLRVRLLAPTQPFRSEIVSDTTADLHEVTSSREVVAIFDGPRPYIKARSRVRARNQIVILDRTAPSFQDAADIVNQQYLRRVADIPRFQNIGGLPWGVEVMAFEEAAP